MGGHGGAGGGGGDIWVLIPLVALMIPIIAIVSGAVVRPWLAFRHRRLEVEAQATAEKAAQYAARTEQLEARIRVLERIVTDPHAIRGTDLAFDIDRLRDAAPVPSPLN